MGDIFGNALVCMTSTQFHTYSILLFIEIELKRRSKIADSHFTSINRTFIVYYKSGNVIHNNHKCHGVRDTRITSFLQNPFIEYITYPSQDGVLEQRNEHQRCLFACKHKMNGNRIRFDSKALRVNSDCSHSARQRYNDQIGAKKWRLQKKREEQFEQWNLRTRQFLTANRAFFSDSTMIFCRFSYQSNANRV